MIPREHLFADLEVDRILTSGAFSRRYLATVGECAVRQVLLRLTADGAVVTWVEWLALTARARTVWPITFVARRRIYDSGAALRHLVGLAEMRWQMKDALLRWHLTRGTELGSAEQPDAIAEDAVGCLAIEYDTGAYSTDQVRRKARTYQVTFGRQVWGVPHAARQRWLGHHLPPQTQVMLAPWW